MKDNDSLNTCVLLTVAGSQKPRFQMLSSMLHVQSFGWKPSLCSCRHLAGQVELSQLNLQPRLTGHLKV